MSTNRQKSASKKASSFVPKRGFALKKRALWRGGVRCGCEGKNRMSVLMERATRNSITRACIG